MKNISKILGLVLISTLLVGGKAMANTNEKIDNNVIQQVQQEKVEIGREKSYVTYKEIIDGTEFNCSDTIYIISYSDGTKAIEGNKSKYKGIIETVDGLNSYLIGEDLKLASGWGKDSRGHWFYFDELTYNPVKGWKQINNIWYYFNERYGNMAHDCEIDGYKLDSNGAWIQ